MRILLAAPRREGEAGEGEVRAFASPAEALATARDDVAIGVEAASWDDAMAAGVALRAVPNLTRLPLQLRARPPGDEPAGAAELFDGIAQPDGERAAQAERILAEAARFGHRATAPGEALAQYLACRPQARLRPVRDWRAPGYYRYPVVEALLGAAESPYVWLDRWAQRRVLDVDVVVDRLRLCDACGSTHLSFLDVCPACGSLDIVQTRLLHCFTCSHVGVRETFVQQERLRCPKCEAILRHIGVDYDRPIEQQQCRRCKHLFVDADVKSACMACDARSGPEQLPSRTVAMYRLGGAGLLLARQGNLSPVLSGLDIVSFVAPALFERLIDWQRALARRYPESYFFSVVGVRIANLAELGEAVGRSATAALVDAFAERLRALLRVSDITTRSDDHLWLLAPHTNAAGAQVLMGRIRALTDATRQGSGRGLELALAAASIPEDAALPDEGSQLMGLLASRLE